MQIKTTAGEKKKPTAGYYYTPTGRVKFLKF